MVKAIREFESHRFRQIPSPWVFCTQWLFIFYHPIYQKILD